MSAKQSYFIFNGIDTRKYGLYVTGVSVYAAPAYSYDVQSVDGRDGDIIYSHGRHDNLDITYTIAAKGSGAFGFRSKFDTFRKKLAVCEGYCQLTDGYNPDYVRYGYFKTTQYASAKGQQWNGGEIEITFSCKPQMFLAEGMDYITYPLVERGKCTSTGLDDATGTGARPRVGWFLANGHTRMYFRTVNASAAVDVTVTQVATNGNTWSSCSQSTVTAPASGAWVSVAITDKYLWFEFTDDYALTIEKGSYLECVFDDTDDEPWRYTSAGIVILNDTECIAKPQYNLIATDSYKSDFLFWFRWIEDGEVQDNRNWILTHTGSSNANFYFDSEDQTVVGENGKTMAKYVLFTENAAKTIFSQSYPVLHPGMNEIETRTQTTSSWSNDRCSPYTLAIKTNIWTV